MFRQYIGSGFGLARICYKQAIHLPRTVRGMGPGGEGLTRPIPFAATANTTTHAIIHAGARPVFVDVEPDTCNLDPEGIEAAITPRTKAILPVHYAGRPCRMDRIEEIARRQGLLLIEDAAHAVEAAFNGRKI